MVGKVGAAAGRERLVATARGLFTRRGAANVGINDVIATAGVAKMTLYNNFPSKDALTAAVYEDMAREVLEALAALDVEGCSEAERIAALFDDFDTRTQDPGHRGCPFIHASLQSADAAGPIHAIVRAYKRQLRARVLAMLDADRSNRDELADQIVLLIDGAVTEAYLQGVADPIGAGKRAATTLLHATPAMPMPCLGGGSAG